MKDSISATNVKIAITLNSSTHKTPKSLALHQGRVIIQSQRERIHNEKTLRLPQSSLRLELMMVTTSLHLWY